MNYGYDETCPNWKEERKQQLVQRLNRELELPINNQLDGKPYLEVDGLYTGVRIRRITHLPESAHRALILKADKIYEEVMRKKR